MPEFVQTNDFLNQSTALRRVGATRTFFNPKDQQHIDSLKHFLRTGNWGKFQFFCEAPFTDVPMTVLITFAAAGLNVKRETEAERGARLGAMNLSTAGALTMADRTAKIDKSLITT